MRMLRDATLVAALAAAYACSAAGDAPPGAEAPDAPAAVPFERFVLPNGLTLIVHEDDEAAAVHVRMFYHVAEKDAGPGQRGHAHLFEHLAFSRTEGLDRSVWGFLEAIGASDYDANSRFDYTTYFATADVQALDTLLWLEAQRMAHLAGALTEEDLRRSQAEVRREAEQLAQVPDVRVLEQTVERTYPAGHPYAVFDIASDDVDRATLLDARRFYQRYYQPANAVLVVAGAVEAAAVRAAVEARFGAIAAGAPRAAAQPRIARGTGTRRERIEGVLRNPHLRVVWNTPGWGTPEADHVALAISVIAERARARLLADTLATQVDDASELRELGGQVMLDIAAPSPDRLGSIERVVQEEVARFVSTGPTAAELEEARAVYRSRIDQELAGLSGKALMLGVGELLHGDPARIDVMLRRAAGASAEDVQRAAREWLADGAFVLEFVPAATA
jgi:zinc protease